MNCLTKKLSDNMTAKELNQHDDKNSLSQSERKRLSREKIIEASLSLIREKGLEGLSMRALGVSQNTSTMRVYRHFPSKKALLDAIVDRIITELIPAKLESTWQDQLRLLALQSRSVILRNPEIAPLFAMEFRQSPTSLYVNAKIIEYMLESGLPKSMVTQSYWSIVQYANGSTLIQVHNNKKRSSEARSVSKKNNKGNKNERVQKLQDMMNEVSGISENVASHTTQCLGLPLSDEQFLFGINCIIQGIENTIENQTTE